MNDKGSEFFRLVYASRAALAALMRFEATVEEILAIAAPNNARLGVSGLLLAHQGWFLQALEGPRRNVCQVFGEIARDPRHAQLELLSAGPTSDRLFGSWSLYAPAMTAGAVAVTRVIDLQADFDPSRMDGGQALALLAAVSKIPAPVELKQAS